MTQKTGDNISYFERLYMLGATVALGLSVTADLLPAHILLAALILSVAVFGVPHGALDLDVARKRGLWQRPEGAAGFACAYILLAAVFFGLWTVFPDPLLIVFLLWSLWHFSGDFMHFGGRALSFLLAACLISFPALFHGETLAIILTALSTPEMGQSLTEFLSRAVMLTGAILALAVTHQTIRGNYRQAAFLLLYGAVTLILHPLISFIAYFCLLHSPRHFQETADLLGLSLKSAIIRALPLTLATYVLAGGVFTGFVLLDAALDVAVLRVVFIGLFALTIPHMVLVDIVPLYRKKYS